MHIKLSTLLRERYASLAPKGRMIDVLYKAKRSVNELPVGATFPTSTLAITFAKVSLDLFEGPRIVINVMQDIDKNHIQFTHDGREVLASW